MTDITITLQLTVEQALSMLTAVHNQRCELERLRQDMITRLSPAEELRAIEREVQRLAEAETAIKGAL